MILTDLQLRDRVISNISINYFNEEKEIVMNKKKYSGIMSLILSLFVAAGVMAVGTMPSFAAGENWQPGFENPIYVGQTTSVYVYDENGVSSQEPAVTSVTSADPSIVKVRAEKYQDENNVEKTYIELKGKKVGSTTLAVTFQTPTGESKTVTKGITVKKYPNHIKKLTVAGKNVKIKKHKFMYSAECGKTSIPIKFTLKKGWKIKRAYGHYYTRSGQPTVIKGAKKLVKKGKAIKFPKKYGSMHIDVEIAKGNKTLFYDINLYR